jgi:predicted transcriptional regulator
VHEALARTRSGGYTTALKLLQIMTEKGLVRRDDSDRTHVYEAALSEEQTQRQLVSDLVDRAFGGSAARLVMQALASKRASAGELEEIRRMLTASEQNEKPGTGE